ncbi:DUF4124 domain-containing protein [Thermomonas alba]|uniref:DUF4124 domain-containing protein n=1 Tax=Thermomonas alba TaxID=2888525 RepID=UPI001F035AD2|nr:DUF4124 domain-containing protein [Thermomonas alba]
MPSFTGLLVLLSIALACPVRAEQLYRCVTPQGSVSYQAAPCAGAARLDRVVEYRPDPVTPAAARPAPARTAPPAWRAAGRRVYVLRVQQRAVATAAQRCRAARERREAALQRLGLKRRYAQLSQLDAELRADCPRY